MNVLVDTAVHEEGLRRLRAIPGIQVRVVDAADRTRMLPADVIGDIHVLFCTFPPSNFGDMHCVEFIQLASAGYSQLYGLPLAEHGVRACNGRGIFDTAVAEWNIAMMVNLARDLRAMIRGLTAGIWGYGGIGRETARLAKALGLTVHVMSRKGVAPSENVYEVPGTGDPEGKLPDRVYHSGQEKEFLADLDFLVLSMPLTKATEGMIGEKELKALRASAFVLNPARGPLIEEEALLAALRNGWIAGAALDTHYHYPMPADHPLWRFPNVIMTPHISGSSKSPYFAERSWAILVDNVERLMAKKPLLNELTRQQLMGD